MSRIKVVGLALMAVFAFSVVVAASASASSFLASKEGLLLGKQTGPQKFITAAGEVECTKARTHGKATSLKALTQKVTVEYTGCKAFGGGLAATVTGAEYEFNADDGAVTVLNTITVTGATGCVVTVGPVGNKLLTGVTFTNSGGLTVVQAKNKGILYLTTASCANGAQHLSNGEYSGTNTVELDGGTVKWDKE